jgi:transcriptional regulator of acetoin/glycerol metabolism
MFESVRIPRIRPSSGGPKLGQSLLENMQVLPAPILRSWMRCTDLGLDRDAKRPLVDPLPDHALRQLVHRNEELRRRCRPELEALYATTRASGSIAILTNAEGLVLDAVGDPSFAGLAAQVALRPGASWAEAATGTNAIGAALVERRAVEVRGTQHFFTRNQILSCAAVPILGPTGDLLGVLDLSGNAKADHGFALGFVQLAVDGIEHRVFEAGFPGCEVVRLHKDPALVGTPREGVLVFRDHILVAANRHGLGLLDLEWEALGHKTYRTLFPSQESAGADAVLLRDTSGRVVHARRTSTPQVYQTPVPKLLIEKSFLDKPRAAGTSSAHFLDGSGQARLARATRLLDAGVPVLVQGETGTGKEVFARAAHAASARSAKPFVAINCTALPESLIEAELFGYEPGAFTGARRGGAKGLLREADGGLLFLDEIGDMPLGLQPRLLRALQEREVLPVGGVKAVPIDVMVICATHRDLSRLVADGSFRADLYYRIASYTVELPTLRSLGSRATLIRSVWEGLAPDARGVTLSAPCEAALAAYSWPGNYRQLAGSLKAMLALAEDGECLGLDALPANMRGDPLPALVARPARTTPGAADVPRGKPRTAGGSAGQLGSIEREAMREALHASGGNVAQAARRLGISRSTLYRRYLSGAEAK